jgi:signal transduction histidine kinase/Tfp pilus assembly protein PilF
VLSLLFMNRLVYIAICLILSLNIGFSQNIIDSLLQALPGASKNERIEIYQSLVLRLWLNHPDSAMAFAREALAWANKVDDDRCRAISTRLIGGTYYYLGDYDSTILYAHRAYALSAKVNDSTLMTSCLNNLGLGYYSVGSYPEALENLLRSYNLKIRIGQTYGMTQTLNNIGLVYLELRDYTKAHAYFKEAYELASTLQDRDVLLYSSNNIGLTYYRQLNFEKSEAQYLESLKIAVGLDNTFWHAAAYSGLADVYYDLGRIDEAQQLYRKSLTLRERINEINGISEVYASFSVIYAKRKQFDSAFYYLRKSQVIAEEIGARDQMIENYKNFHDFFKLQKRYDSALYYQSKFIELRDSLFNENLARNIGNVQLQLREEEARFQLAGKDQEIRRKTILAYILAGVVLLVMVFSYFGYKSYKRQRELTDDLEKKNKEVLSKTQEIHAQKDKLELSNKQLEAAQEKIRQQNETLESINRQLQSTVDQRTRELEKANMELKVVNLELDNFIYKSSHDIKGPLVRLLGVCHVALLDVHDNTAREYFSMLYDTARHLNEIFDRLKVVSDINTMTLNHEPIKFEQILDQVTSNLKRLEGFSEVQISANIDPATQYHSDSFLIETIFHNMLENAIRFQKKSTSEHKFVSIEVGRRNGSVLIRFRDNGIGIKQTDVEHIFNMFSKAALEHQTVGLGLYIVKQCVSKLNGTVTLVQSDQKHTEFEVKLPANHQIISTD